MSDMNDTFCVYYKIYKDVEVYVLNIDYRTVHGMTIERFL